MKYLGSKILRRHALILRKGFPKGWLLWWKPTAVQKSDLYSSGEYFPVIKKRKTSMRCLQNCLYCTFVLQTSVGSSQIVTPVIKSLFSEMFFRKEKRLKEAKKEINKFIELIDDVFNRIYFFNSCQPVYLCSGNETFKSKLSQLLYSDRENHNGLTGSRLNNSEDHLRENTRIRELLKGEDTFVARENKLGNGIINELEYVINNLVSDKTISNTLDKARSIEFEEMDVKFWDYYYRALMKLNNHSSVYEEHRKYLFDLVETAVRRNINVKHVVNFLSAYANYVKLSKENYSKDLISHILNMTKKVDLMNEDMFSVLKSQVILRHHDICFVTTIKDLTIENPALLEESVENLYILLEALSNTHFHIRRKKYWPFIRNFISELQILNNADKWNEAELFHHLNVAKVLSLYGIYSRPLLNSLWEKCNNGTLSDDREILNLMIVLNQAIFALHPSFNKSFLNENILISIEEKLKGNFEEVNEKIKEHTEDVKAILESEIYELDCILNNCYTKQGLKIDLLLALNKANEPYSFTKFLKNPQKKIFIEDISLPKEFQILLIILVDCNNHSRKIYEDLDSEAQLKLKSLEAMGFVTVPIPKGEWNSVNKLEQATYFWKVIRDKNSCSIPEHLLEKAREPEMF